MKEFFDIVSKRHLNKLIEERDYYVAQSEALSKFESEGFRLMADLYNALIVAAEKFIEENS